MQDIMYEKDLMSLWFDSQEEINYNQKTIFLKKLGSLEACFYAKKKELLALCEDKSAGSHISDWITKRSKTFLEERYGYLRDLKVSLTYPERGDYPKKLLRIFDPPYLLYVKGKLINTLDETGTSIGVVGSRSPDTYGREIASYFSKELAQAGIHVISGLASGVDGISHRSALSAGGYTVGVLGCGINVVYPQTNLKLYEDMETHGAIVSEFGPDLKPIGWRFPTRNRIISGLSDGVLCVQAKKGSGSLITTNFALEQNRQVYAVPARAFDLNYEGTNNLIKSGAFCATSPEDIINDLREMRGESLMDSEKKTRKKQSAQKKEVTAEEKKILSCLNLEPCYIDDVIAQTGYGITQTISSLYVMEEKGLVKQVKRGWYIVADFTRGVTYR